jgi:coenzyme F420-reducing hydrogenase delta subunit
MDWVSASEANRFADVVEGFTQRIRELGPLETKEVA